MRQLPTVAAGVELSPALGMTSRLGEMGISHNHLPILVADAMKQGRLPINNPREMTCEAVLKIYTHAL